MRRDFACQRNGKNKINRNSRRHLNRVLCCLRRRVGVIKSVLAAQFGFSNDNDPWPTHARRWIAHSWQDDSTRSIESSFAIHCPEIDSLNKNNCNKTRKTQKECDSIERYPRNGWLATPRTICHCFRARVSMVTMAVNRVPFNNVNTRMNSTHTHTWTARTQSALSRETCL